MSFADDAKRHDVTDDAAKLDRALSQQRSLHERTKSLLKSANTEVWELRQRLGILEAIEAQNPRPPKWTVRSGKAVKHHAILTTILSDSHWDEVVRGSETDGLNEYNRDIATRRLEDYGQGLVKLARKYLSGVEYDGMVLMLGGDLLSGDIHDELRETNEDTMLGSVLYWCEQLTALIRMFADEFGKVHIPCVVGNHGRMTRKPRAKLRARDNFDWFIARSVRQQFDGDSRVTWQIPDSTDAIFPVYDTVHLLTHGDQVTGGQGIGGIWPPIKRLQARKHIRNPHDVMVLGHWHQLITAAHNGLIVNGSLKGLDEYAMINNFKPEPPQQAMWLVTPERGVTWQAPVQVD
jgi:hypothetical protein